MEITYTDQEIAELIEERKMLPDNWLNQLYKNDKNGSVVVNGDNGNTFRIIARQNKIRPSDFSVILAVIVPLLNRTFRLRRYNGWTDPHKNPIENGKINRFHIHFATERYQEIGYDEETYAEETDRYSDLGGALQCLIDDANFEQPPQSELTTF